MRPFHQLWEFQCDGSVISVAATPNCSTICAATVGRSVYLFDGDGRSLWAEPFKVDFEAWATSVSDDSRYVAIGTAEKSPANGTVYVVTRDGRLVWSKRLRSPIWSVSLSVDGEFLAVSTWANNRLYFFRRQGSQYVEVSNVTIPGDSGLYGAKLSPNGQLCVVASYGAGLFVVEQGGAIRGSCPLTFGLYNVSMAAGAGAVYVATHSGSFVKADIGEETMPSSVSSPISQRPLCGINVSENGLLIACGSFDGRVIVATDRGEVLWDFQSKGEVWATAISRNGSLVCAGGGDQIIRLFKSYCDTSAYQEVRCLEDVLSASPAAATAPTLGSLIELYRKYQLAEYGYNRLTSLLKSNPDAHLFKDQLHQFLSDVLNEDRDPQSSFHLGDLLTHDQKYFEAVRHFQQAARSPSLRSSAQRRVAACFTELGLKTAATSAWRQSREQHLDDNARHILFALARSYDDCADWAHASQIYEMILSWDADFRNSWDKLTLARRFRSGLPTRPDAAGKDNTGATVSLLGPDAPRGIDTTLTGVAKARQHRELLIHPGDRERVKSSVHDLLNDAAFSRGIRRDSSYLSYDTRLFVKYDFGLPEDEMKKFLETVNALPLFETQKTRLDRTPYSLDIGSATGRYPRLLHRLGFQAVGIDVERDAIDYSTKHNDGADWPKFIHGDARELTRHFAGDSFDVITCMMGTFEHIPRDSQANVVSQIFSLLTDGGVVVISVWDVECPHLAYLSIYDENQKEMIRQNSRTRSEMHELLVSAGCSEVSTIPFSLLQQTAIYDLGIEHMKPEDIEIAAQADLAARALFSDRHGEMFLGIGYRGGR